MAPPGSRMRPHGTHLCPAHLPRLTLPLLRPTHRRALRTRRCPPYRRGGTVAGPPEPRTLPQPWVGQPLRGTAARTDRRRCPAEAAHSSSACRQRRRRSTGLRRRRERVAPMRRGEQPRARLLLPPLAPLGRSAHRRRVGLPVHRSARLCPRELAAPMDVKRVPP